VNQRDISGQALPAAESSPRRFRCPGAVLLRFELGPHPPVEVGLREALLTWSPLEARVNLPFHLGLGLLAEAIRP
jgi:hypothetical protein